MRQKAVGHLCLLRMRSVGGFGELLFYDDSRETCVCSLQDDIAAGEDREVALGPEDFARARYVMYGSPDDSILYRNGSLLEGLPPELNGPQLLPRWD